MSDKEKKIEINKVQISDAQEAGRAEELTEAEQDKVTGGGGYYGYAGFGNS